MDRKEELFLENVEISSDLHVELVSMPVGPYKELRTIMKKADEFISALKAELTTTQKRVERLEKALEELISCPYATIDGFDCEEKCPSFDIETCDDRIAAKALKGK